VPIVAIGGIHAGNAADAIAAGARGIAVVSAICAAPDAEAATRELLEVVAGARDR
jgi:thiamine-phosphate pyrophosphorylase